MGRNNIALSENRGKWIRILPGMIISLVALAVVISLLDFRKFGLALAGADIRFVLGAAIFSLLWLVVRGFVWQTLLQNKASYRDAFLTINEGYLLNNILPFRLGELARAFLMSRKANLGFWQIIPTILIERVLDLAFAVSLFLFSLPFVIGTPQAKEAAITVGILAVAGFVVIYLVALNRQRVLAWLERAGQRSSLVRKISGQRVVAFFDGLAILTSGKLFLKTLALECLNWLVAAVQYYLLLWAFFPHPSILWAIFALGAAALGIAAPSSPGAIGVFEAALVAALVALKLDASIAAAFALVTHALSYLFTGLIGGYGLYRDGESLSSLYTRLGRMRTGEKS